MCVKLASVLVVNAVVLIIFVAVDNFIHICNSHAKYRVDNRKW